MKLIKHGIDLIASRVSRNYEGAIVRNNHRDIAELSVTQFRIAIASACVGLLRP